MKFEQCKTLVEHFFSCSRPVKRIVSILFDAIAIITILIFTLWASRDGRFIWTEKELLLIFLTLLPSIVVFTRLGFYRAVLRYVGVKTIIVLFLGITLSSLLFSLLAFYIFDDFGLIQGVLYWCLLTTAVGGARLIIRAYIEGNNNQAVNVAIYGAGAAGRQLVSVLKQGEKYNPVLFIDDDKNLHHSKINSLEIIPFDELEFNIRKHRITSILLALPSTTHARISEILSLLESFPVKVKKTAGIEDVISGKANISDVREIEIEDLLGRDAIPADDNLLHACITNKVVMVTGAGGSIGAELCRKIINLKPAVLVLYELSEFALYSIDKELVKFAELKELEIRIVSLIGSVQHKNRLIKAMKQFSVQTIYHAAAYKHVPIVEHNIVEGIRNNVFGTWYAAEAAVEAGVERFVLISTDKAVRPTNVMGASKRVAELVLQAMNKRKEKTIFTMVRFGNVLGSSGSVVPLFREQIEMGGPVTVTHKDIIRYFMTIPEAALLVLQAGAMGKGGDVFVLDMGEQVKIADLAERMIHLMGYQVKNEKHPQGDIELHFSGLRPGEKLYEELLIGENVVGTKHPKVLTAMEESLSWKDMQKALILLNELCDNMDYEGIIQMLLKIPTGYNPQHEVVDLLMDDNKDKNNVFRFKTLS